MEAAAWETSQGLDPEDYDFQVPWLSFVGHFLPPLGRFFVCVDLPTTCLFFCTILGPSFGSFFGTQNWASRSGFNRILITGPELGPIFWSIFGTHFWAPDLNFFVSFLKLWVVFFWCLELAAWLLRACSGPRLLGPLVGNSPRSST